MLLALAGCGRSYLMQGEREAWRHDAEETCMKSGAVKVGTVLIDPIEGPGMCGMDFPLKVSALAEAAPAMSYSDDPRPPASIPNGNYDQPQWPPQSAPRYAPPVRTAPVVSAPIEGRPVGGERMRWVPGPQGVEIQHDGGAAGQPMSLSPGGGQSPSYESNVSPPYQQPTSVPPYRGAPQYVPPRDYAPQTSAPQTSAPQSVPSRAQPQTYSYPSRQQPTSYPRQAQPMAAPAARQLPDDIPDDAEVPDGGSAGAPLQRRQPAYNAPVYQPPPQQQRQLPKLGPQRPPNMSAIPPAALQPAATLACPIVSALDRWVSEGVQPAAMHWFGSPVAEIHQIGGYNCRGMVGGSGVSEHSFGNALDVAGFTLANGRKVTVKDGWHGRPEEQGFLHDVQLYACETFTTVLAPGYNIYHYDHIHVDLMHRREGYRPCRPEAIPGEVAAAKARTQLAAHSRGPAYTGSIGGNVKGEPNAVPGADGDVIVDDGQEITPRVKVPRYLGAQAEDRLTIH